MADVQPGTRRQERPDPESPEVYPQRAVPPPKSALREYAEALVVALALALFVRSLVVQAFKIPSGSMLATLQIGDHLLINKLRYGLHMPILGGYIVRYADPQPGDVVVFVYPVDPSKDFIKRVIAVGGELVEVRNKKVYVDGRPRDFPQAYFADGLDSIQETGPRDNYGPVKVPAGHLFMLGDNRDRSYDSRFWGFVDASEVEGKAILIYWSWDGRDRWVRWERMGELIH